MSTSDHDQLTQKTISWVRETLARISERKVLQTSSGWVETEEGSVYLRLSLHKKSATIANVIRREDLRGSGWWANDFIPALMNLVVDEMSSTLRVLRIENVHNPRLAKWLRLRGFTPCGPDGSDYKWVSAN